MQPKLLSKLRARSAAIRSQWEALLRVEPVTGPLANPDVLAYLIPNSLEQIFAELAKPSREPLSLLATKDYLPACDCRNNPYFAYFIAGKQALVEAVVLAQAGLPVDEHHPSDVAATMRVVRRLARSEIDAFCGACDHRGVAPRCRHALAV